MNMVRNILRDGTTVLHLENCIAKSADVPIVYALLAEMNKERATRNVGVGNKGMVSAKRKVAGEKEQSQESA